MTVAPFRYLGYRWSESMRALRSVNRTLLPASAWVGALALGCAAGPAPRPPHTPVERSETLPAGYVTVGTASAACRERPAGHAFSGVPATNFACGRVELERALTEQANARGGTLLAREECRRTDTEGLAMAGLACSAEIARPSSGAPVATASDSGQFTDSDDLAVTVASRIRIDVESTVRRFDRRARPPADVTEFAALPIGHVDIGLMRARCRPSDCDADQARAGLRLAAGGLGVSDLAGVRCFAFEGERTCVATLGVTERDPESDARAR
jgi:hypothetical protein